MFPNHHGSHSGSRHERSRSKPRNGQMNSIEIVRFINDTETGKIDLRTLRNFMFQNVDPRNNSKFQVVWTMLAGNKDNFVLNDPQKNPTTLNGQEVIWVRTILGLCKTHCRRGKDGRNRACDGDCGALHVCRTFLLLSGNACPYNKKGKCYFGHSFMAEHNVELLKAHNLLGLHDDELQRLFRRRPSRSASTLPELCIYYNNADGKKCSRDSCKALHVCSNFIQQRCEGHCLRNHKFTTPQVSRILDLFAIDRSSWSPEMLMEDLRHFMTARHRNNTGSYGSDDDSDVSEFSEPGAYMGEREASSRAFAEHIATDSPSVNQMSRCAECEDLKRVVSRMQLCLTSQVTDLKAEMTSLNSRMAAIDGKANRESKKELPGNDSMLSADEGEAESSSEEETEPKFVRSQHSARFSGIPPNSSQIGAKMVIDESD